MKFFSTNLIIRVRYPAITLASAANLAGDQLTKWMDVIPMNVTIIGVGYVGLVVGACLADVGNKIICQDLDERKIARLMRGEIPIYEPNLGQVVERNCRAERLLFTTSYKRAVDHADVIFLAVGTPQDEDGSADVRHLLTAAERIGSLMKRPLLIVNKSTAPVGTVDKVRDIIRTELFKRELKIWFDVVSNPEFLKEGAALDDFMQPDRVIVGADDAHAFAVMRQLYAPFTGSGERFVAMNTRSAELTKYAANAMLATRISFMNELAGLAEQIRADIESVRRGIGIAPRIGLHFLYAGAGYGGSCFPKDIKALLKTADQCGRSLRILQATEQVNENQKNLLFQKIAKYFNGTNHLREKSIALWGLSFKPETDDMREAPSLVLIRALFAAGAQIRAYDPVASSYARQILVAEYGEASCDAKIVFAASAQEAVEHADILVLITEWPEFRSPDVQFLARTLRAKAVFDGRNIYDSRVMTEVGLYYEGIGRAVEQAEPMLRG